MLTSALVLVFGVFTLPTASLPSAASSFAPHSVLLALRSSHSDLHPRQLSPTVSLGGAPIPLACEGRCESTVPVFNACTSGTDVEGCLGVCKILDPFVQCCNCLLVNDQGQGPAATGAQFRAAENQLDAIVSGHRRRDALSTWSRPRTRCELTILIIVCFEPDPRLCRSRPRRSSPDDVASLRPVRGR